MSRNRQIEVEVLDQNRSIVYTRVVTWDINNPPSGKAMAFNFVVESPFDLRDFSEVRLRRRRVDSS